MGLITNLVRMKSEQDFNAKQAAIQGLQAALTGSPTREAREWANRGITELLDNTFGGGGKGKGGKGGGGGVGDVFKGILSRLSALNPATASQGTKDAIKEIGATRPPQLQMTPEEQETASARKEAIASGQRLAEQKALDEQKRQAKLQNDQEDWEIWSKRADEVLGTGASARDRAEFIATKGQKLPTQSAGAAGTPRMIWGKVKGEEGVQPLFVNPKNPSNYVAVGGRELNSGEVELTAAPPTERLTGRPLEIAKYVQGQGFKPGTPEFERRYSEVAGADIGIHLGRVQQQAAIDQAQSGIGLGAGIPPSRTSATAPAPAPKSTPAALSAPSAPSARVDSTRTPATSSAAATAPADDKFISMFLGDLLGTVKTTGGAAKVGVIKGQEALRKLLKLGPVDFSLTAAMAQDDRKAFSQTIQRAVATQRVNEVLNEFGDEVVKRADKALQTGSPILNKPIREIELKAVGDPDLRRFMIALNGFQRQYGILTSGSPQSIAQLPVTVGQRIEHIIDPNATLGEVIASVDQVKTEGRREAQGFKRAIEDTAGQITGALGGKGVKYGGGAGAGGGNNLPKPDKPGKRISVEQAIEYIRANGGDKKKAMDAAKAAGWSF